MLQCSPSVTHVRRLWVGSGVGGCLLGRVLLEREVLKCRPSDPVSLVNSSDGAPVGEARMRRTPACLALVVSAQRPGLAVGLVLDRIGEISLILVFTLAC